MNLQWSSNARKTMTFAVLVSSVALGAPLSFADNFEGPAFDSFWTVTQQFGTASLSTAQAQSGVQSVQFSSTDGGQRQMSLTHQFASPVTGTFSVYFYDAAPGQETLYQQLSISNSSNPSSNMNIGVQDFDAYCYMASVNGAGPNANCGVYPQGSTTSILRTPGWHQLLIDVQSTGISGYIDGALAYSQSGSYSADRVDIFMSGPFWRPNTAAYFDTFSFAETGVPEPAQFYLIGAGLFGLGVLRKIRCSRG